MIMKITIRDVARKAGVSPATVSLVLNNRPGVGNDTRKTVEDAAEALNYRIPQTKSRTNERQNGIIRFLKIARHGHILNRDHNVFISDYIEGIEAAAREEGYSLEVRNYASFQPDEIIDELRTDAPAGAVILATELDAQDILPFSAANIPMVFIDAVNPYANFDFVDMDNEGAVFSIVEAMKERGIRRIGLVSARLETRNFRQRAQSFYQAVDYFGLETKSEWDYRVDSTYDQSYRDMSAQLDSRKTLPQGLFCVCDIIAFGCMKALKEKNIRIPEDISLVGFDDLPSSQHTDPPLASIKVSKKRIGRRAFQLIRRRIESEMPLPYEKVFIGSELMVRESLEFSQKE